MVIWPTRSWRCSGCRGEAVMMSGMAHMKGIWTRALLKGIHYKDRHKRLDMLYRVQDPWGLDSDQERTRFRAVNEIILRELGELSNVLEVGCGEGHNSVYLEKICENLTGVDISPTAVA